LDQENTTKKKVPSGRTTIKEGRKGMGPGGGLGQLKSVIPKKNPHNQKKDEEKKEEGHIINNSKSLSVSRKRKRKFAEAIQAYRTITPKTATTTSDN